MLRLWQDLLAMNEGAVAGGDRSAMQYAKMSCTIIPLVKKNATENETFMREFGELIFERSGGDLKVSEVFSLQRSCEDDTFRWDLENRQLLFHGSKRSNFYGILSRYV